MNNEYSARNIETRFSILDTRFKLFTSIEYRASSIEHHSLFDIGYSFL